MLLRSPLSRERLRPAGFIKPCHPTLSEKAPSGPQWIHEIKHDGYRIVAVKRGDKVRLWSRNGRDLSREFTAITDTLRTLPDCTIDGEACAHRRNGLPHFSQIRAQGAGCSLFAFDLLFLDGTDLRRLPLADRKARLKAIVRRKKSITYVDHLYGDGATIFEHARRLGLEGIVSKRCDLSYRSGRSASWLKIRNPDYERGGSVRAARSYNGQPCSS